MSFCKARDWSVRSGSDRSAKRWDALVLVLVLVVLGGWDMVDSMVGCLWVKCYCVVVDDGRVLEFGSGAVSKSLYEGSYRMSCTNVCGLIDYSAVRAVQ